MDDLDKRIAERLGKLSALEVYPLKSIETVKREFPTVWAALREKEAKGDNKLKILASAMKKVLPPHLLQEVIDHCDPLAAFLRDGFGIEALPAPLSTEEGQ